MIDYLLMGTLTFLSIFLWVLNGRTRVQHNEYEPLLIILIWPLVWLYIIGLCLTGVVQWLHDKHLKSVRKK